MLVVSGATPSCAQKVIQCWHQMQALCMLGMCSNPWSHPPGPMADTSNPDSTWDPEMMAQIPAYHHPLRSEPLSWVLLPASLTTGSADTRRSTKMSSAVRMGAVSSTTAKFRNVPMPRSWMVRERKEGRGSSAPWEGTGTGAIIEQPSGALSCVLPLSRVMKIVSASNSGSPRLHPHSQKCVGISAAACV